LADHKIGMMVLSFMDYLFLILFLEFLMFYFYQVVSFVFYLHLFFQIPCESVMKSFLITTFQQKCPTQSPQAKTWEVVVLCEADSVFLFAYHFDVWF